MGYSEGWSNPKEGRKWETEEQETEGTNKKTKSGRPKFTSIIILKI